MSDAGARRVPTPIREKSGIGRTAAAGNVKAYNCALEANMWTRRVLLATMVAACAMSLPRHVSSSWNVGLGTTQVAVSSLR